MKKYKNPTYFAGGCLFGLIAISGILQGVGLFGGGFDPVGVLVCLGLLAFAYRGFIASKVVATDIGVVVVNPMGARSFLWDEISHFRAGNIGLELWTVRDGVISCFAVQRARITLFTGRESIADRTAGELNALLEEARQSPAK